MLKQLVFTVGALACLAACADSPVQPTVAYKPVLMSASEGEDRVEICQVDPHGSVRLITVAAPAVAAQQAHGNVLAGVVLPVGSTFSASASYTASTTPDKAFDGSQSSGWNAGNYPTQWIEVDFGSPQRFSAITALVNQFPLIATTNHDVTLDGLPAFSWSGVTNQLDMLSHRFGTMQTAQKVRITTTVSPSWVAWIEIQVLGCIDKEN